MYDYIIIGGGIIGCSIAYELSKYELKVLLLEELSDCANNQTSANSAIIHSGHDPLPGTLKAKLCVRGNELYDKLEGELSIPLLKTGAFVLAFNDNDIKVLEELYDRAQQNGVKEVSFLDRETAIKLEPNINPNVVKVLSLPTTKITYPWETTFAFLENAIINRTEYKTNKKVTSIKKINDHYSVIVNRYEQFETKGIINCAGVNTDLIAKMIDKKVEFEIKPRKGEYIILDKAAKGFVNHVLYPLPSAIGKGVLLIPQYHGNILIGPTSTPITERDDLSNTRFDMNNIKLNANLLANNIPYDKAIRTFAGIRATSNYSDFYIKESLENKNIYHVAGIDSPGLTSAPGISEYLINLIKETNTLTPKIDFNPIRKKRVLFKDLNVEEQERLIKIDPRYGNVICKCEKITEREVMDAINGVVGINTIKGIKKRLRCGAGLCQGGYCENVVLKIIARETHVRYDEVNYYNPHTEILVSETKVKK
jgi:glycerol-3-phosphate dehydrogenase